MQVTQVAINNAKAMYEAHITREEVENAEKLFTSCKELVDVLKNPTVDHVHKHILIDAVLKEPFSQKMRNALKILCDTDNMADLQTVIEAYYKTWDKEHNILHASLTYAQTPDPTRVETDTMWLKRKYPDKKIDIMTRIDASILGGVIIRTGHHEFDKSYIGLSKQLEMKITGRWNL